MWKRFVSRAVIKIILIGFFKISLCLVLINQSIDRFDTKRFIYINRKNLLKELSFTMKKMYISTSKVLEYITTYRWDYYLFLRFEMFNFYFISFYKKSFWGIKILHYLERVRSCFTLLWVYFLLHFFPRKVFSFLDNKI